jgi:hypothetical protein
LPTVQFSDGDAYRLGLIDASSDDVYQLVKESVSQDKSHVQLQEIRPDSTSNYMFFKNEMKQSISKRDSLYAVYVWTKNKRTSLFLKLQKKKNKANQKQLIDLYDIQTNTKDMMDSIDVVISEFKANMNSSYSIESKQLANRLLNEEKIDAYIYLEPNVLQTGKVQYHSSRPGHFFIRDQFEQVITNI